MRKINEKNNIQKSIVNRFFVAIIFKYFYQSANKLTALQKLYILYKVFSNNKINEIYYKIIDKDYH